MIAEKPSVAKAFAGRWRFVEMDAWDIGSLDGVEEAHLTFSKDTGGEFVVGVLQGALDVRYGRRDGSACAEFSWEGHDEEDPASGRGWFMIDAAGNGVGHLYTHDGEDSAFVCKRDRK